MEKKKEQLLLNKLPSQMIGIVIRETGTQSSYNDKIFQSDDYRGVYSCPAWRYLFVWKTLTLLILKIHRGGTGLRTPPKTKKKKKKKKE